MDDVFLSTVNAILVMGQFPLLLCGLVAGSCIRHDAEMTDLLAVNLCRGVVAQRHVVSTDGATRRRNIPPNKQREEERRKTSRSDLPNTRVTHFWLSECLFTSQSSHRLLNPDPLGT